MTVPAFTTARFSILAAAVLLTAWCMGSHPRLPAAVDLAHIRHSGDALGQDNGTLTSGLFLSSYAPRTYLAPTR